MISRKPHIVLSIYVDIRLIVIPEMIKLISNFPIIATNCVYKTKERMINDRLLWFLFANCPCDDVDCVFQQGQCTFIPLHYITKLLSSYRWYVYVLQARKGLIIQLEITKREEKGKIQIRPSNYNFGDKHHNIESM
jgi:hypothetical protein